MADAQPGVSSTPPVAAPLSPSDVLASASPEALTTWRETGKIPSLDEPSPTPVVAAADSTPAPPAQAASTDAIPKADSDTADQIYKDKTEKRFQELLASNAELKRELAALRQPAAVVDAKPAASSPATAAPPSDPRPNKTDAAKYPDGQWDEQFQEDLAEWKARQVIARERAAHVEEQRKQHTHAQVKSMDDAWAARMTATKTKHADFDEAKLSELIPPGSPIDRFALEIDGNEEVLYHLFANPAEIARLSTLPVSVQMGELHGLKQTLAPPPAKTITDAPPVSTTLGTRTLSPNDVVTRALNQKDVGGYIAAANARDAAVTRH